MRVLVACEESQVVCKAFRAKGHEAYSCDLQACSGGHPEWHLMMDALQVAKTGIWDLVIAFPPCTHLTCMNASHWKQKQVDGRQPAAIEFVKNLYDSCDRVVIENPRGILSTAWMKPTQIVHPYYFGDPYLKMTCLWIKGLPRLAFFNGDSLFHKSTVVEPIAHWVSNHKVGHSDKTRLPELHKKSKLRSKTFPGIAQAMADQWG